MNIFSILDDMEMYEKQEPFRLQDFINMSQFLNMFVYKSIMGQLFGKFFIALVIFLIARSNYVPRSDKTSIRSNDLSSRIMSVDN